jgi:hypothetical protein
MMRGGGGVASRGGAGGFVGTLVCENSCTIAAQLMATVKRQEIAVLNQTIWPLLARLLGCIVVLFEVKKSC